MDGVQASPIAGVTLQTAQLNGITIRYASAGDAASPLVVLCHGWPESWYSWRHQLVALAGAGFYAIAPDMRGFGGTDAPKDPALYDHFKHISGDILALMAHVGHGTAAIVGHDWGAAVAWNLAVMRPDKFPKVCAMSVPRALRTPFTVATLKKQFNWKAGAPRADNFFYMLYHNEIDPKTGNLVAAQEYSKDPREFFERMMGTSESPEWQEKHTNAPKVGQFDARDAGGFMDRMRTLKDPRVVAPWLSNEDLDYYANEYSANGFAGGLNYYRCMDHTVESGKDYLSKPITQPALFIGGTRDMVTVMFGGVENVNSVMAAAVPNCSMKWLECGHWIQNEKSAEVNSALIAFLKGGSAKL